MDKNSKGMESLEAQKKKELIAALEFQLLQVQVDEYMQKKKYEYSFYNFFSSNILEVHVAGDYWIWCKVSTKNIEPVLGRIPLLVVHPEKIPTDGLGFKMVMK